MIVLNCKEEEKMNSYKEMYYYLFNQITDINEQLKKIQQATEEMYLMQADKENYEQSDVVTNAEIDN